MPQIGREEIKSYRVTIKRMFEFAAKYSEDCRPFARMTLLEFWEYVKDLEYRSDTIQFPEWARTGMKVIHTAERLSRPRYTLSPFWDGPRDCDDKATCIKAFCNMIRIPCRFVACRRKGLDLLPLGIRDELGIKEGVHHVYPEVYLPGAGWTHADATYPDRSRFGLPLYDEALRVVFEDKAAA